MSMQVALEGFEHTACAHLLSQGFVQLGVTQYRGLIPTAYCVIHPLIHHHLQLGAGLEQNLEGGRDKDVARGHMSKG